MKNRLFLILLVVILFSSCRFNSPSSPSKKPATTKNPVYITIDAPKSIRERAFAFAELYADSDTHYVLGGQDSLRAINMDCSGLIVMSYKYALVDTKYELLFNDSTASDLCTKYTTKTDAPQKGDLIFMTSSKLDSPDGTYDKNKITHVAIYDYEDDDNIYYIDSTDRKAVEDDFWDIDVDGVTRRYYPKDAYRIKSFGRMKIRYQK